MLKAWPMDSTPPSRPAEPRKTQVRKPPPRIILPKKYPREIRKLMRRLITLTRDLNHLQDQALASFLSSSTSAPPK